MHKIKMYFTPTIFLAKLLAAMQVLMTLDTPLSTTMALPVTSKPIESTVENLAWQAWIELPPEQKQQVKSRKVTPKSIFTLPLRVKCPDGQKQVDTKCIPIVIGTNDVLIDLNALNLLVGSTQPEDLYDYDDMTEELVNPLPFGIEMPVGEAEKASEGLKVDLKPPSKDEPLKFNIFENKFHILHEDPSEDYASILNEGLQSSEKEQNITAAIPQPANVSSIETVNLTVVSDFVSEASNISGNNSSLGNGLAEGNNTFSTLADDIDFKIDAISVPVLGFDSHKQNQLSAVQNESSVQLVTTLMDAESTTKIDAQDKQQEYDIQTLLQTESFLPFSNHTTTTTLQSPTLDERFSLPTISLQEPSESVSDVLNINVEEEITTLPSTIEEDIELKYKQEYTRSATLSPISIKVVGTGDGNENNQVNDSTLETVTNDEPSEITIPIQLDEMTIIETHSSLSTTPSTQQELKELQLQQEQTQENFQESLGRRKGQEDQHVVSKKSKVQPVGVLSTTTEASFKTTTTAAITSVDLPTATKNVDVSISSTAETVTPLLAVHNENDSNDRFYYQHFAKPENEVTQHFGSESKQNIAIASASVSAAPSTTATTTEIPTGIKTIPLTSEIDLAKELRLINELVKGKRLATTLNTTTTTIKTTTTTTKKPTASTFKTTLVEPIQSSSPLNSPSESLSVGKKPALSTSQIWSKIMPLLTTSTTPPVPKTSSDENVTEGNETKSNDLQLSSSSVRSNRNSKIIRINTLSRPSAATDFTIPHTATTTATPKAFKDSNSSLSTTSDEENLKTSKENNTYDTYWWLPLAWRVDKSTTSESQQQEVEEEEEIYPEEPSLLLRLWSAYAPRAS